MNVYIYTRENNPFFNTKKQQQSACEKYAAVKDLTVVGITDEISEILTSDLKFDAVLVTDYSRISRSTAKFITYAKKLKEKGVEIIRIS